MDPKLPLALAIALSLPAVVPAQNLDPDEDGCKDSVLVTRMPRCRINECSKKDFDAAEFLFGYKDDDWVRKSLEGATEILDYECAENVAPLQIARNMEAALRKAGYTILHSGPQSEGSAAPMVNARNGAQWIEIRTWVNGGTPNYKQVAVKVQEMQQEVAASAEGWAAELAKSGRVAVYGIQFDTGKAAVQPDSEPVLQEIVKMLNADAGLKLRVEGHTDNVGGKAANQALSDQRAAAVVAWLVSHGVAKTRLAAQGFGDTKPVADNASEEGRTKNRRVELVKM